jgi:dipeptidyl aminopeptidase/acylaminoacyl peptidase
MLDLQELINIPTVDVECGFSLSPDGKRIAFSWDKPGTRQIFEKNLSSGSAPVQVSLGPGSKFHPAYSPDGQWLAFSVDPDGSEHDHIFLLNRLTGVQTDLTPSSQASLQVDFSWSPDSRHIALISDQSGQFNVYVIPLEAAGGVISNGNLVLDTDYAALKVNWSPDGRWLAVVVEAEGINYGLFIVPSSGGKLLRVTTTGAPMDAQQAKWSPDSRRIAFTSDEMGWNNIGLYDLESQKIHWMTEGEGEKQHPSWSPDGEKIAYVYSLGAVSWLAIQKIGGERELYQFEPGVIYTPVFSQDGQSVLFVFDNPRHPPDIWTFSLKEKRFKQLTFSLPKEIDPVDFKMPEEIVYPGMDGTPVPALLFKPDKASGPAVLLIHGGPDWLFEMTWYPIMAHLSSRGWTVLVPNYRGSTGYGRAWQEASRFDFGGVDTDDVAAGAFYLLRNKLADEHHIGVTGRSHGGYLTASCLTRYPDLWAVGSAVVPFLNWFTNHAQIRLDLQKWDLENFGDPQENEALWRERSPSFFLDRITAPLQLICGRHDVRCPVSDSYQAAEDLREMGKEVELLIYEDEGHIFLKKGNVLDAETRRVEFLRGHLEGENGPA